VYVPVRVLRLALVNTNEPRNSPAAASKHSNVVLELSFAADAAGDEVERAAFEHDRPPSLSGQNTVS
jgi:hypothetical protein